MSRYPAHEHEDCRRTRRMPQHYDQTQGTSPSLVYERSASARYRHRQPYAYQGDRDEFSQASRYDEPEPNYEARRGRHLGSDGRAYLEHVSWKYDLMRRRGHHPSEGQKDPGAQARWWRQNAEQWRAEHWEMEKMQHLRERIVAEQRDRVDRDRAALRQFENITNLIEQRRCEVHRRRQQYMARPMDPWDDEESEKRHWEDRGRKRFASPQAPRPPRYTGDHGNHSLHRPNEPTTPRFHARKPLLLPWYPDDKFPESGEARDDDKDDDGEKDVFYDALEYVHRDDASSCASDDSFHTAPEPSEEVFVLALEEPTERAGVTKRREQLVTSYHNHRSTLSHAQLLSTFRGSGEAIRIESWHRVVGWLDMLP